MRSPVLRKQKSIGTAGLELWAEKKRLYIIWFLGYDVIVKVDYRVKNPKLSALI